MIKMSSKLLQYAAGIVLLLSASGIPAVFAATNPWQTGGDYSPSNMIGSWVDSNVQSTLSGSPDKNTFVWQGGTTSTSYFEQQVLRMNNTAGGWRVEFWGFNSGGTVIDKQFTNMYATPGCSMQYGQYFQGTNKIYSDIQQSSGTGCSSFTASYTFQAGGSGSYGSTFNTSWAVLESYDTTCSDFTGFGNTQFTSGLWENSSSQYATPTFSTYATTNGNGYSAVPSCFSTSTGSGTVTVTYS